jgi:tyrosyl-tRNA synthetase
MGGSDQWGNITAGTELIARREGASAHALVFPLLTTAGGAKFGKSEEGNVWLDPARTSPYRFYQFWLNTDDRDVERCLKLFTFFPMDEVAAIAAEHGQDPGKRVAQRRLAEEMTARIHGTETARGVVEASRLLFGGTDLRAVGPDVFRLLSQEIPTAHLARSELDGLLVADALVRVGLASSKGDARRGIQGSGFSLNGEAVGAPDRRLAPADLLAGRYVMLQKGRRNYALLAVDG